MSNEQDNLIRLEEVKARTGLSRSAIYSLVQESKFPKIIKLGERTSTWSNNAVSAWIEEKKAGVS